MAEQNSYSSAIFALSKQIGKVRAIRVLWITRLTNPAEIFERATALVEACRLGSAVYQHISMEPGKKRILKKLLDDAEALLPLFTKKELGAADAG